MCKPVRYVYPHCGHLIVQDKDVWTVERCTFARCYNRDCWISNDVPEHLIEKTPWPHHNLTEMCPLPHEKDDSTESATLAASSVAGERVPYYSEPCVEEMTSVSTSPEPEDLEDEEMDRMIRRILFTEGLPADCSGAIPGEEEFHIDDDDSILQDDQLLLGDEELGNFEADLAEATPFTEDQIAYFNEIIAQTADELSFAGVEDNIEWEKVQAVEASLEQSDFGQDMNMEWRFDEWF